MRRLPKSPEHAAERQARALASRLEHLDRLGPDRLGHPGTGNRQYSDDESAFLVAVAEFRHRTGIRFLLATHYLAILKSLGYRKAD